MRPNRRLWAWVFLLSGAIAACGNLPHESPFDERTPLERQAKASLRAKVVLQGESDFGGVGVRLENSLRSYNFTTANDGAVSIPGVVPGRYDLSIYTRFFQPVSETVVIGLAEAHDLGTVTLRPAASRVNGSAVAKVVAGNAIETVGGVMVSLRKTASIRGAGSQAPANFAPLAATASAVYTTLSGFDGAWSIEGVPAGVYEVSYIREGAAGASGGSLEVTGDELISAGEVVLLPLTGFFKILGQNAEGQSETFTNTPHVTLELSGFNAHQMRIGRSSAGTAAGCTYAEDPIGYTANLPYVIAAEGLETVCVRYIDTEGRETDDMIASIFYDATPPQLPLVLVNNGAPYTTHPQGVVTLTLNATDEGTGLAGFRLASEENAVGGSALLPYEPSRVFVLDNAAVDGLKAVWVSFYDKAGNYSEPISATIMLDRKAPNVKLEVPGGSLVNSNIVMVDLEGDADTALMQLSNDPGLAGAVWQTFQPAIVWTFLGGQGERTLYARFQDYAGNQSGIVPLTVNVDMTPPSVASVNAAVISDTIVWEHFGPGVKDYTVELYDQGMLIASTTTTDKRLKVGRMHPGYTVIANYTDGTVSNPSYSPGYEVPATVPAYIGLRLSAPENRLLARIIAEYGLGTTTTECGQVTFVDEYSAWLGESCGNGSQVRVEANHWSTTPPPFEAVVDDDPDNPFAGLSPVLRVSGSAPAHFNPSGGSRVYLKAPRDLQWPYTEEPQIRANHPVISGERYSPVAGMGRNQMRLHFPISALAISDDATFSTAPFTGSLLPKEGIFSEGLSINAPGQFAGISVEKAAFLYRYWEGYILLNDLWGGSFRASRELAPGAIRLPFYTAGGVADDATLTVENTWSWCDWNSAMGYQCTDYGTQVTFDAAASSLTLINYDPWAGSYFSDDFSVSNANATRQYRLPMFSNHKSVFTWAKEYDQSAAFAPVLKRMVQTLAAPTRVRGTGKPVLTQMVTDASEMQIGTDADFSNAEWQAYQDMVTLPEGTSKVWVRYRDPAGNVTPPQEVSIVAPETAPRFEQAILMGANGNPGYTTETQVTAYLFGSFSGPIRARVSTSPLFQDSDWSEVGPPQTSISFTDPLTGEKNEETLKAGFQYITMPLTLPDTPGLYTYYFWVADASNNFSSVVPAMVAYDSSRPEAEFSLKAGGPGELLFQARWSVSKTPALPSLAAVAPAAATEYVLPFEVPFLNTASNKLRFPEGPACFSIGHLEACPLSRLPFTPARSISVAPDRVVLVWQGEGEYGVPVTTAATVFADGTVRLSYWQTLARVPMHGHVDLVETPFADWHFALAQGSVEYRPNQGDLQFLLRSQNGVITKVIYRQSAVYGTPDNYRVPNPWQFVPVTESGHLVYTGTAYSLAGAAGRTTVREVSLPGYQNTGEHMAGPKAVPLTDGRYWLSAELGDWFSTRFRLNDLDVGASPVVAGAPAQGQVLQEMYWPDPWFDRGSENYRYTSGRAVQHWLEPSLRLYHDGDLPGAGAPMTLDFEHRMAYGADGSIWDLSNPYSPAPVRVFGGNYPFDFGSAVRVGQYLWSRTGVWDLTNPELPAKVANVQSATNNFAAYGGYVYEASLGGELWVYDAAQPTVPPTPTAAQFGPTLYPVGNALYTSIGPLIRIPLNGDADPIVSDTGLWVGGYSMLLNAGEWTGMYEAYSGSGHIRVYGGPYMPYVNLYQLDLSREGIPGMALRARQLISQGPWVYGVAKDKFSVGHFGAALPGAIEYSVAVPSGDFPLVAADQRYRYVCHNATLYVYNPDWSLALSKPVNYCSNIKVRYPYVWLSDGWYKFSGASLTLTSMEFCSAQPWGSSCERGNPIGDAISTENRVFIGAEQSAALAEEHCTPVLAAADVVYCNSTKDNSVKATTASAMRYSGIVTGPHSLPMVTLLPGEMLTAGGGEYFSTFTKTYRVRALNRAEEVYPDQLTFFDPNLAADYYGRIYRADETGLTLVAIMEDSHPQALSPDGTLLASGEGAVRSTRWGPATPRLRYVANDITEATSIAVSHGYVYIGTPQGVVRLNSLVRAGEAYPRGDVVVRHTPGAWSLLNTKLHAVKRYVEAPSTMLSDLCGTVLEYRWQDPERPWTTPVTEICAVENDVPASAVFEGELTGEWLAFGGYDLDTIGSVTSIAVGKTGLVFVGVEGSNAGVYVYDPADTALMKMLYIPTADVVTLAVDDRTLYIGTVDKEIIAYDFSTGAFVFQWSVPVGNPLQQLEAGFGVVAYTLQTGQFYLRDPADGALLSSCGSAIGGFVLTSHRWGGEEHPVMLSASGESHDLNTCQYLGDVLGAGPGSEIQALSQQDGFLIAGYKDHGVWIRPLSLSREVVKTGFTGRQPAERAVILGNLVYTVSRRGALQIFQMH